MIHPFEEVYVLMVKPYGQEGVGAYYHPNREALEFHRELLKAEGKEDWEFEIYRYVRIPLEQ